MSNVNVGNVYNQIIRDVVESSRVDFEEGGVDESVLDELMKTWQSKLSDLRVAVFPWDPKPEPQPEYAPHPNQAVPQQQRQPYQMDQPQVPHFPQMPPMPHMQPANAAGGVRIKTEPGLDHQSVPPSHMQYAGMANITAAQRAAQNLQNSYGARAQASINAIQGGMPQQAQQYQGQPQAQQQQQRPAPAIQRPSMTPTQYQQAMAQQAAQQRMNLQQQYQAPQQQQQQSQQAQGQYPNQAQQQGQQQGQQGQQQQGQSGDLNGIVKAQVDGSAEDEDRHAQFGVFRTVGADGDVQESRVEIDNQIRLRIEAQGKAMEGGGLMLPLKVQEAAAATGASSKRKRKGATGPGQTDGGDSDDEKIKEEDDEDAINSDLDDSEDDKEEDDDDEETQWVMLCMYDKVQRVKNKWKCVMKDGVLTINGKDYVFHKASGEYEW